MNDMTRNEALLIEKHEGVATVTLNRPDQINAVNDAIRYGMPAAMADFEQDESIRAIVIRGAGERGFCGGADIKENRGAETPVKARERLARVGWIESVNRCPKPVIAAIHGFCMGGGMELALAADIRIASPDAIFALPETALGLIPGGGGTQRLPRLIGMGRALDMLLTGERVDAQEAMRIGLVTRLAADREALYADAQKLAEKIASRPPTAIQYVKDAAYASLDLDLDAGVKHERNLFTLLLTTEDRKEAALAFKEKRKPNFKGQ